MAHKSGLKLRTADFERCHLSSFSFLNPIVNKERDDCSSSEGFAIAFFMPE